jgi:hypothetical protein
VLPITNDAFWNVMPSVDKEIHTTTYMLSYLGSTVKRTTCFKVQKHRQTNYITVVSQKYRQTNYMLSRPRSAVNYMLSRPRSTVKQATFLSRPRSTVKQTTCCRVPEVPSNKIHAVASQKYRQTNYMLSRPRSTVKLHCCRVPEVPANKLHCCRVPEVPSNKLHC